MNNIKRYFEDACFGDKFLTRDGSLAVFLRLTENSEWDFADFYVKDWGLIRVNRTNGKSFTSQLENFDIVEPFTAFETIEDAAKKHAEKQGLKEFDNDYEREIESFKAGAKWQGEQGFVDANAAVNGYQNFCDGTASLELGIGANDEFFDSIGPDDYVTIQIRKKTSQEKS